MSTRKIREHVKNGDGTYDVVHRETEAELVSTPSGKTVLEILSNKADLVDGKVNASQLPSMNYETPIKNAAAKTNLADADTLAISDSAATNTTKRITWANAKAVIKTWADALYALKTHSHTAADVGALSTKGGELTGDIFASNGSIYNLDTLGFTNDIYVIPRSTATLSFEYSDGITVTLDGIATPTDATHAANKVYVDNATADTKVLRFGANGTAGQWDRLSTTPVGTTAIRYNGYLRATRVYGMYYSDSADYAEAYAVEGAILPGELVMVGEGGQLTRNTVRGNPRVVGIVSTDPASIIGTEEDCEVPIAMAGRVPVRVVGPVLPGDLLTGSEVPGALERAESDVARGAIVAQALTGKTGGGEGLVTALVVRF